jgi:hypothetical protein
MISNEDYHADPAVSASHLKAIQQSPFHYFKRYVDPARVTVEPTAAMRLGTLVHTAVLEPYELSKRYGRCPSRATKAGKEMAAQLEANGIEAITDADWTLAEAMRDSVRNHAVAAELLSNGKAEQSFWWNDQATGLRCKCRPDWFYDTTIVDLKTCIDASPESFAKAVVNFGYHIQASHYLSGLHGSTRFVFIAVEKTAPYCVGVYELDAAALSIGDSLRTNAMDSIVACRTANRWPGYSDASVQTLTLPRWASNPQPQSF